MSKEKGLPKFPPETEFCSVPYREWRKLMIIELKKLRNIANVDIKELIRSPEARAEAIGLQKVYNEVLVLLGVEKEAQKR